MYFVSGIKSRSNVITAVTLHLFIILDMFLRKFQDIFYAGTTDSIGIIHIIDKVLEIPASEINTVTEAELSGFAEVLSTVPPDPRIYGVLGSESDWTMYVFNSLENIWPSH